MALRKARVLSTAQEEAVFAERILSQRLCEYICNLVIGTHR